MAHGEDIHTTAHDDGALRAWDGELPKLGRYLVLDRLGAGGMGTVFLARDPDLDRNVAVKLLRGGSSEQSRLRMQREAQAMAQVSHDNVTKVFDVGRFGDEVFMAMEYLSGGTLAQWLAAEQRGWREIVALFIAAGRGLAAAHAVGLIHRDFKPANVLLDLDGVPKVTDFGLVRSMNPTTEGITRDSSLPALPGELGELESASGELKSASGELKSASGELKSASLSSSLHLDLNLNLGSGASSRSALSLQLTQAGISVGTPAYMPPEQFRGRNVDARSDQFSFCVALHEALWGVGPFEGADIRTRLRNVINNQRVPRPHERDVPEWLFPLIDRGLRAKQDERWPSMAALLAALADDPAQRRKTRRRWAVAIGLTLALGAGAFAGDRAAASRCEANASAASELWTARSEQLDAALRNGGMAYAETNVDRVHSELDAWVGRWGRARRSTCSTTLLHPSPAAGSNSERCLDAQLAALTGLLIVLDERADSPGVAAQAITAVEGLPDPSACEDPRYAAARHGCTPELERAVHELRALELAKLEHEGVELAERLLADMRLQQCPELEDQVSLLAGRLVLGPTTLGAAGLGARELASRRLHRALHRANRRADLSTASDVAITLAELELQGRNHSAAEVWLELAQLLGERLGSPLYQLAELDLLRARVSIALGDYDDAQAAQRSAETRLRASVGEAHPLYLRSLETAARLELAREQSETAVPLLREAGALAQRLYGPEHPRVAQVLLRLAPYEPDLDRRLELAQQVLAMTEAASGPDSSEAAVALRTLGTVRLMRGENELARPLLADALARFKALEGAPPQAHATAYAHYGICLRRLRENEAAHLAMRAGLELLESELGSDHPQLANPLLNLANVVEELGQLREAVEMQRRALVLLERVDPNIMGVATLLDNMAMLELDLGHEADALRAVERAATIGRAILEQDNLRLIDFQTDLALAEEANELYDQARERFMRLRERCDVHPEPDNHECVYTRGIIARFLLDARARAPELLSADVDPRADLELALSLSARSVDQLSEHTPPTDAITLRFIRARALADSGATKQAERICGELLAELAALAPRRRRAKLHAQINAWFDREAAP